MNKHLWRVLLVLLCAGPLAVAGTDALVRWLITTKVVSARTFLGGEVLHELPYLLIWVPMAAAVAALGYVAYVIARRGPSGLPNRPRATTWLILANFVSPAWLIAIKFGNYLSW